MFDRKIDAGRHSGFRLSASGEADEVGLGARAYQAVRYKHEHRITNDDPAVLNFQRFQKRLRSFSKGLDRRFTHALVM